MSNNSSPGIKPFGDQPERVDFKETNSKPLPPPSQEPPVSKPAAPPKPAGEAPAPLKKGEIETMPEKYRQKGSSKFLIVILSILGGIILIGGGLFAYTLLVPREKNILPPSITDAINDLAGISQPASEPAKEGTTPTAPTEPEPVIEPEPEAEPESGEPTIAGEGDLAARVSNIESELEQINQKLDQLPTQSQIESFTVIFKTVDSDGDGVTDYDEIYIYKTNPQKADSDDDGFSDQVEIENGYNPNGEGVLTKSTPAESAAGYDIKATYAGSLSGDLSADNFQLFLGEGSESTGSFTFSRDDQTYLNDLITEYFFDEEANRLTVEGTGQATRDGESFNYQIAFEGQVDLDSDALTGQWTMTDTGQDWLSEASGQFSLSK